MSARRLWSRILLTVGGIAMLVGAIDPRESKRPLLVRMVVVMLCLMALAEYKDVRGISGDGALSEWVFGASAAQLAYAATRLVSLLLAVVTSIGLWGMRPWAMACYTACAVVLVAEEVLGALSLGFGWNEVLFRSVFAVILLCTVGIALLCAIRKAAQPDELIDC